MAPNPEGGATLWGEGPAGSETPVKGAYSIMYFSLYNALPSAGLVKCLYRLKHLRPNGSSRSYQLHCKEHIFYCTLYCYIIFQMFYFKCVISQHDIFLDQQN